MLSTSNGTPCNRLPKATPITNGGTKLPIKIPQSHIPRHFGDSNLER